MAIRAPDGANKQLYVFRQDFPICNLKGRDCIVNNSKLTFNCSTSCDGIYADTSDWGSTWSLTSMIQPLVSKYEEFKQRNVQHFRFNSTAVSSDFGM